MEGLTIVLSAQYWIIPVAVFGALFGSFLNVVIFRLPRGLSVLKPRWSFCPHCGKRIRAYHNLPIVGWLFLRGRCHDCRSPIGVVYPVIECATALLFVMIWDALFIGRAVPGIGQAGLAGDWPLALAYLTLFACLLATAAMDIESYIIDIRLSVFTMIAGVVCHTLRGMPIPAAAATTTTMAAGAAVRSDGVMLLPHGQAVPMSDAALDAGGDTFGLLPAALCLIGAAMGVAWWLTAAACRCLSKSSEPDANAALDDSVQERDAQSEQTVERTAYLDTANQRFHPVPIITFALLIAALALWQLLAAQQPERPFGLSVSAGGLRGFIACVVFMFLLVLASLVRRESDQQIVEDIESERDHARPTALRELAQLIPAIVIGIGLVIAFRAHGLMDAEWVKIIGVGAPAPAWVDHLQAGGQSVAALVLAAALGWGVRILGTLVFGKEAFGSGDIYIMAAIGAVAGFWATVFAFFLAAILALVGVVVTIFWKSTRAVPFGPWLALGAFVNLWLYGPLLGYFGFAGTLLWSVISGRPVWPLGG